MTTEPEPGYATFAERLQRGDNQVVWTTLVADLETPVSAFLKLAEGLPHSFLLDSVEGGTQRGRYSFIGFRPDLVWRCRDGAAAVNRHARTAPDAFEACDAPPLDALRALLDESHIDLPRALPPMAAGLVGYMAYDMVRQAEPLPDANPDTLGVPDGIFLRPTVVAVFDNVENVVNVVTPVWAADEASPETAWREACARLDAVLADFDRSLPHRGESYDGPTTLPTPDSTRTREQYHQMVETAKEYVRAGDVYQVVPSQRFSVPFELPPFALYRTLRRLNPSPYMFYMTFEDFALVGASPEILVRLRDDTVTVRPIAGTRKRGADAQEDRALAEELVNDPKERAEHLMLLDLGRNDVGRVARAGSVRVTEQMAVEYYSHVMHIVSNVQGDLADGLDAMDALMAGFPAGTVSGAPKVRAMEIIDELEPVRRGVYAGCIGYFSAAGGMDTCIALRTAVVKDNTLYVQAGGGVVHDSDPEAEYQESRNKAMALLRAAEEALRFAARYGR